MKNEKSTTPGGGHSLLLLGQSKYSALHFQTQEPQQAETIHSCITIVNGCKVCNKRGIEGGAYA